VPVPHQVNDSVTDHEGPNRSADGLIEKPNSRSSHGTGTASRPLLALQWIDSRWWFQRAKTNGHRVFPGGM